MNKKDTSCAFDIVREDDYVEYFIFPEISTNDSTKNDNETLRKHFDVVLKQCQDCAKRLITERNYLWHKDEFNLQIRIGDEQERLLNEHIPPNADPLIPHLHGITYYGENIEDEWFIVYLVGQITREVNGCIARIVDSDGEFMLIEAADALPEWADPETCEQRVYISNGILQLIQNSPSNTIKLLPVPIAISKIRQNPTLYNVSKGIQKIINERLKMFDGLNESLHHQILRLPIGIAAILKERPDLVASAVRAFLEHDVIDIKACKKMQHFPTDQCVRLNVCFTRCLYAMLVHNNFMPDRKIGWKISAAPNADEYKEELLGIKVACGFEILATNAKNVNNCDGSNEAWRKYLQSLTSKGYFRSKLEGSEEYTQLLNKAITYFQTNNLCYRTASLVGTEILELVNKLEVNVDALKDDEKNLKPSENDNWMYVKAQELDEMLAKRYGNLNNANNDLNAEKFTKDLQDFLCKKSDYDGIVIDSKIDKKNRKKNVNESNIIGENADGENSSTQLRDFLEFVIPEDKWDSNSEMSDYEDEDDLEINIDMTKQNSNTDVDIRAYMQQMDEELSQTTLGRSFEKETKATNKRAEIDSDDDFDDIETFKPIDINVNTLKNMVDSYKSQAGGVGPVSHLFNAMGIGMATAMQTDDEKDIKESAV